MSGFNKKGYKQSQRVFVTQHTKSVYFILKELDNIYEALKEGHKEGILTEENLAEIATPLMGRELDNMELNILKGKFGFHESEDNNK